MHVSVIKCRFLAIVTLFGKVKAVTFMGVAQ